jgi:2-isopropylmalate synthase
VPYLPIDPHDVGRSYEAVIRVNSQSGKGGVAYVLKNEHHLDLPRRMQIEFSRVVQVVADDAGGEISPRRIWELFGTTYLQHGSPLQLVGFSVGSEEVDRIEAQVVWQGEPRTVRGKGNGPIAAFVHALSELDLDVRVLDYAEHATGAGEEAQAASYLEVAVGGRVLWGCGLHPSIVTASLRAIVSAVNRATAVS